MNEFPAVNESPLTEPTAPPPATESGSQPAHPYRAFIVRAGLGLAVVAVLLWRYDARPVFRVFVRERPAYFASAVALYTGDLWPVGELQVIAADARPLTAELFAVGFRWTRRPLHLGRGLWHPELQIGADVIEDRASLASASGADSAGWCCDSTGIRSRPIMIAAGDRTAQQNVAFG